jgi:hypothetical protein
VSTALSDKGLHRGSSCDGMGFVLVATLWTGTSFIGDGADVSEHLWTLTLAVATFMILIYVSSKADQELMN